jgi:hypothetical protein
VDRQEALTFNENNIAEFRASKGRIASFGDAPLLLLTTTGARSGHRRTSPMMYLAEEHDPNRVYVFASAAGVDQNRPGSTTSSPAHTILTSSSARSDTARQLKLFPIRGAPTFTRFRPVATPASPDTRRRRHDRYQSSRSRSSAEVVGERRLFRFCEPWRREMEIGILGTGSRPENPRSKLLGAPA